MLTNPMDKTAHAWQAVGSYFGRRPALGLGLTLGAMLFAWGLTNQTVEKPTYVERPPAVTVQNPTITPYYTAPIANASFHAKH